MIRAVALCLAALPGVASAQDVVPMLHDVTGVAANDVLNVRAGPSATAEIIGTLAPDETHVEVVATDDSSKWGRIGMGERNGWVSMAFLERRSLPGEGVPDGMRCFGTEPFWSIAFRAGQATLQADAGPETEPHPVLSTRWPPVPDAVAYAWSVRDGGADITGTIRAGACSDGMSDRLFGWQTTVVVTEAGGVGLRSGCCTLDGR